FSAMHGRMHGTHGFARRVFAMHAGNGLEERTFRFVFVAFVISVDANPVHLTTASDLLFTDDGNVVLSLAREDAGVASDATVQVDRHAPRIAIALVLVIKIGIERPLAVLALLVLALIEPTFFLALILIDSALAQHVTLHAGRIGHQKVRLRRSDDVMFASFCY